MSTRWLAGSACWAVLFAFSLAPVSAPAAGADPAKAPPAPATDAPAVPAIPEAVRNSASTVLRIRVRPHSFPDLLAHAAFAIEGVPGLVTARGILAGADEVMVIPADAKPIRCEGFLAEDPRRGAVAFEAPRLAPLSLAPAPAPDATLYLAEPGELPRPMKIARTVETSAGDVLLVFAEPLSITSIGSPLLADDGKVAAILVKSGEEPVAVPAAALALAVPKDAKSQSFHRIDPDAPLRLYFRASVLNALAYYEGALQALRYAHGKGNWFVELEYGTAQLGCGLEAEAIPTFMGAIHALGGAGSVGIGGRRKETGLSKEQERILLAFAWRGVGRAEASRVNHQAAADAFRRAVAIEPNRAESHLLLGQMLMALHDFAGAEAAFREAIRLAPRDPAPRCALATLLLILDRDKEAQELAKASGAIGADVERRVAGRIAAKQQLEFMREGLAQALRGMGLLYLTLGQPDKAVEMLTQAAKGDPKNAEALALLGGAQYEMGDMESAIRSMREAVRLKPDYPEAWLNLGGFYQVQQQFDNAMRGYSEAARRRPNYPEVFQNRGLCLLEQDQLGPAIQAFEEALKAKPDFISAKVNLAVTRILRGKKEEIDTSLASLKEIDPEIALLGANLVAALEIVDKNPASPVAKVNLGYAYSRLGLWARAIRAFQSANETAPNIPEVHYGLGVSNWSLKRLQKALYEYGEAIRLRPDFSDAHVGLGNVQMLLRQPNAAAAAYETALRFAPDHPIAMFGLGRARARQGRMKESAALLEKVRKVDPTLGKALENFLIK